MTHPCPVPGCKADRVPDEYLFCRSDWRRLPEPLRNAFYAAKRRSDSAAAALAAAQEAAIRAVGRRQERSAGGA